MSRRICCDLRLQHGARLRASPYSKRSRSRGRAGIHHGKRGTLWNRRTRFLASKCSDIQCRCKPACWDMGTMLIAQPAAKANSSGGPSHGNCCSGPATYSAIAACTPLDPAATQPAAPPLEQGVVLRASNFNVLITLRAERLSAAAAVCTPSAPAGRVSPPHAWRNRAIPRSDRIGGKNGLPTGVGSRQAAKGLPRS